MAIFKFNTKPQKYQIKFLQINDFIIRYPYGYMVTSAENYQYHFRWHVCEINYAIIIFMTDISEPVTEELSTAEAEEPSSKKKTWLYILIACLILAIIVTGVVLLAGAGNQVTAQVRDIFIILMALVSFIIGVALVVLIIQIATLINLLQNEIKPILKSTSETVNTLKGTTTFLSDNLASPVIKINSSVAGARRLLDLIGRFKK
mgnify:CR=1 FL=1